MENKIRCKVCHTMECYHETENDIDSYLCMNCGYTTTSLNKEGSIELRKWEMTTPELIKNSKFIDTDTDLVWYPSVLNFPSKGIIFPDGTNENNWNWRVAKVVEIPEGDRSKYPIPGKDGEYYSTRLDMKNSIEFNRNDFKNACIELGILESK
jgi:hypothetical protein